jgi:hypothetical protein
MKYFVFVFAVFAASLSGCSKRALTIRGSWETVTSVGFKWVYQFGPDGSACRKLPEYFDAIFCYSYSETSRTQTTVEFVVETREGERWQWDFVDDAGNIADVTVTAGNGERQRFILKRLK